MKLNTYSLTALTAMSLAASLCMAQPFGSSSLSWQASTDNGSSWSAGTVNLAQNQRNVRVRAFVDWSQGAGIAFGSFPFDGYITNASIGDTATNLRRPFPLDQYISQTINAQRFGTLIKLDDSRDTAPIGAGLRYIHPFQQAFIAGGPHVEGGPISVFEFDFIHDGSLGPRVVGAQLLDPGIPPLLYTTREGGLNRPPNFSQFTLTINVIPTPASIALPLCLPPLILRRRRLLRTISRRGDPDGHSVARNRNVEPTPHDVVSSL